MQACGSAPLLLQTSPPDPVGVLPPCAASCGTRSSSFPKPASCPRRRRPLAAGDFAFYDAAEVRPGHPMVTQGFGMVQLPVAGLAAAAGLPSRGPPRTAGFSQQASEVQQHMQQLERLLAAGQAAGGAPAGWHARQAPATSPSPRSPLGLGGAALPHPRSRQAAAEQSKSPKSTEERQQGLPAAPGEPPRLAQLVLRQLAAQQQAQQVQAQQAQLTRQQEQVQAQQAQQQAARQAAVPQQQAGQQQAPQPPQPPLQKSQQAQQPALQQAQQPPRVPRVDARAFLSMAKQSFKVTQHAKQAAPAAQQPAQQAAPAAQHAAPAAQQAAPATQQPAQPAGRAPQAQQAGRPLEVQVSQPLVPQVAQQAAQAARASAPAQPRAPPAPAGPGSLHARAFLSAALRAFKASRR